MKLNHINLTSIDVAGDVAMFESYFGLIPLVMRGKTLAILQDEDGMVLVLNDFAKKRGSFTYPVDSDVHHIGFIQGCREQVDIQGCREQVDALNARQG